MSRSRSLAADRIGEALMAFHPTDANSLEGKGAPEHHRFAAISVDSQSGALHPALAARARESDAMLQFASASQLDVGRIEKAVKTEGAKGKDQPIVVGNDGNSFGGPASPEFNARVQKLVNDLPKEYRDFINKHHLPIGTTQLVDKDGQMTGGFNARTDNITLSEKALSGKSDEEFSLTLRHEIAHAYDKAVSISGNRDFSQPQPRMWPLCHHQSVSD